MRFNNVVEMSPIPYSIFLFLAQHSFRYQDHILPPVTKSPQSCSTLNSSSKENEVPLVWRNIVQSLPRRGPTQVRIAGRCEFVMDWYEPNDFFDFHESMMFMSGPFLELQKCTPFIRACVLNQHASSKNVTSKIKW